MITKNPMQLKAIIKNRAVENRISAQLAMQNYMMERLLERISLSEYRHNFIIKGGFLIASIVGLDTRATMDMDTTVKGLSLTHESVKKIFEEICAIAVPDNVIIIVVRVSDIREGDDYPGLRVHLKAEYPPLSVPLTVDVTTGDKITPHEVEQTVQLMFEDRSISIMAYNLETILSEKLETVLSRNVANTRPRDFYDIHILYKLCGLECDMTVLKQALIETTAKRGSDYILTQYRSIIDSVRAEQRMREFWEKYRSDFSYAREIAFEDVCDSVLMIMDRLQ